MAGFFKTTIGFLGVESSSSNDLCLSAGGGRSRLFIDSEEASSFFVSTNGGFCTALLKSFEGSVKG